MSRQYDAKHAVLAAYPTDRQLGIDLFLEYLNISEDDFRYEEGMSPEEYIYGDVGRSASAGREEE